MQYRFACVRLYAPTDGAKATMFMVDLGKM